MELTTENAVNVIDPDTQEIGSIPKAQLADALSQGYTEATPEEAEAFVKQQKYGTLGQQAIAGLEGAAQAATFGLSTGVEKALGVSEEDILGRREENPITHIVGQAVGLGATALLPGAGTAGVLTRAGEVGTAALGLQASRVGSAATKAAIETMMVQGGDEVSKMLANDPNQSVETAVTNIGLSGILGGGLGAGVGSAGLLWDATIAPKLNRALDAIQGKAGGVDGLAPDVLEDMIQKTGLSLQPEIKAALSKDPRARQLFQSLQESATSSGEKAQEALGNFKKEIGDVLLSSFGKTADDLDSLVHLSEYEAGKQIQQTLEKNLKSVIDPNAKVFDDVSQKFKDLELPQDRTIYPGKTDPYTGTFTQAPQTAFGTTTKIADDIAQLAQAKGFTTAPSSPEMKLINRIMEELPAQKTLENLRNYQSMVGAETSRQQMWGLGKDLRRIFREAEEDVIAQKLGETAPNLLSQHQAARQGYRQIMEQLDDLNSRLHVGRYSGPESFLHNLKEMGPEDILRRLSGKGDADLLNTLQTTFPEIAQQIRSYHVNNLLKAAAQKAGPGEMINTRTLIKSYEKMSPELRSFVLSPESNQQVQALQSLMEALPGKMNTSGTAKTLDALWNKIPGGAVAMAQLAFGNNPIMALPLAYLTNLISRDAPDAVRLATLKFLGAGQKVDAGGFKAMVDFIKNTVRGENLIGKSAKALFKSGSEVLPQALLPNAKQIETLDKKLEGLQKNPDSLLNIGGKVPHYLPEQGTVLAQLGANAVNYLNRLRPTPQKMSPLDSEPVVSPEQKAQYERALGIAEQPLVVMKHIKEGTLLPQDLVTLKTVYPALYTKLSQQLTNNMMDAVSEGVNIPYKTRMGMSLFLGQPLDSTMLPQSIQAVQATFVAVAPAPQGPQAPVRHKTAALNKLAPMYATGSQSREAAHAMK